MTVVLADALVAPLLLELRDCLRGELVRTIRGPVCRCALVHSFTTPVMDACHCECGLSLGGREAQGDAWVRLVRLEPDVQIAGLTPQQCVPGWQAVIEIGTHRCAPITEDGSALPEEELTTLALDMASDRAALLRVFACSRVLRDRDTLPDFYQPLGPEGRCAGGVLQFRVALPGGGC